MSKASSTQHFSQNIQAKKMKASQSVADIEAAMSPYSRKHPEAFWAYLCGRAMRAINRGETPSRIENLAMSLKADEHSNVAVPCDNDSSTIGCGDAIIEDNIEFLNANLSAYTRRYPGKSEYFQKLLSLLDELPVSQRNDVIMWAETNVKAHIDNITVPSQDTAPFLYEWWRQSKPLPPIEGCPDERVNVEIPDNDVDDDADTGITTRTNVTFLIREMDLLLRFSDFIMDVTCTSLPNGLVGKIPKEFYPAEGPNPYGKVFSVDSKGLFFRMMAYLRRDNMTQTFKDHVKPVLLNYMNRFLLMDEADKRVLWLRYNDRGHIDNVRSMNLETFKESMWTHGDLTGRRGENMFNLWKGMPMRSRVYQTVKEPNIGPQRFMIPDQLHERINLFLGFKVELEYDLENWKLGTAADENGDVVDIAPVINHIRDHFAQGDEFIFKWLLKWFYSVLIEKRKTEIALIFGGEQGSGKGLVINRLIGKNIIGGGNNGAYKSIVGLNLLVGRFNYATGGKLLICGNEVDARTKHKSDALKDVVTEDTRNLEPKGKEAVEIDDFTNLIITTNNIDCVKIEETDRRYFIQDIPLPKMDTETRMKYFEDLTDACDNPLSAPEFYAWLKHTVENDMSIRNIKLRKIPYTKAKQSRILDDQHPMYRWLQERYVNNPSWETNDNVVQYDLLRSFQTDDLYKNIKTTSQQFTKMFEKLGFQAGPERLGRCWKMMPLEEYKSAMIACGKWDDTL